MKWGLIAIGSVLLLALVAQVVAKRIVDADFIRERIAATAAGGGVDVDVGDASFDLLRRQIALEDVTIVRPSGASIEAARIEVRGVPLGGTAEGEELEIGSIRLRDPVLTLPPPEVPDSVAGRDGEAPGGGAQPTVRIGRLRVENGTLIAARAGSFPRFTLSEIHADARDVVVGEGSGEETGAGSLEVRTGALERTRSDSLMRLSFDSMRYESSDGRMVITAPRYEPTLDDGAFFSAIEAREDRVRVSAARVEARDYDLLARLGGDFVARAIEVDSLELDVFSNQRIPSSGSDPWLPHELVAAFSGTLDVDTVLAQGRITYSELPPEEVRGPGRIDFENLSVTITGVSNDPEAPPLVVATDFELFGAQGTTTMRVPLNVPEFQLDLEGSVGPIDLPRLTALTVPLQGIEIQKGRMEGMRFDIEVRDRNAGGTVWLVYDDLDIQLVDRVSGEGGLFSDIKSFVANTFVLDDDNVAEDGEPADVGRVAIFLPARAPFFSRAWTPVREGMMSVARD